MSPGSSLVFNRTVCSHFRCENDEPLSPAYKVSKEKVERLGIKYIPLKESLHETIEWMKEKNLISF